MMPRGPSENPRASADLNSDSPVSVSVRRADKRYGNLIDKTPGDPTDPIETRRGGDRRALAALLDHYRDRLRRMVELRLDPRLRGPLDASDVVQEAFLDVAADLDASLADPRLAPMPWLCVHVGRRLTTLHRRHLDIRM